MVCLVLMAYTVVSLREGSCPSSIQRLQNNSPHILSWERLFFHLFRRFFVFFSEYRVSKSALKRKRRHHRLQLVITKFTFFHLTPLAFFLSLAYTMGKSKSSSAELFSAKSGEAYRMIYFIVVAPIQAVRPTVSGTDTSGESYREWKLSKAVATVAAFNF